MPKSGLEELSPLYIQMITKKRKELLIALVEKCEQCGSKTNLEVHRLRRGCQGGTYEHRNTKILCKKCHQKYHYKEGPKK